jgi:hypothetical protein
VNGQKGGRLTEKAKLEARKKGLFVSEQVIQDGSILVQIRETF